MHSRFEWHIICLLLQLIESQMNRKLELTKLYFSVEKWCHLQLIEFVYFQKEIFSWHPYLVLELKIVGPWIGISISDLGLIQKKWKNKKVHFSYRWQQNIELFACHLKSSTACFLRKLTAIWTSSPAAGVNLFFTFGMPFVDSRMFNFFSRICLIFRQGFLASALTS